MGAAQRRLKWALGAGAAIVALIGLGVTVRHLAKPSPGVLTLQEAWAAVQRSPEDAEAWGALGDAQSRLEQLAAAESSYRTGLRLGGDEAGLSGRLGFVLYEDGDEEEARRFLKRARELGSEAPLLDRTIAILDQHHAAVSRTAPDTVPATTAEAEDDVDRPPAANADRSSPCTVPVTRAGPHGAFVATLEIDGRPVPLVVDTGASMTTLTLESLDALGLTPDQAHTVNAVTATGSAVFPTVHIRRLELEGRRVDDLMGAVCHGCGGTVAGGLLGLDAQAALGVNLDSAAGVLRFQGCR